MPTEPEIHPLLVMHRQTGGNPRLMTRLLVRFGSAASVLREATPERLVESGLPEDVAATFAAARLKDAEREVQADLRWLSAPGRHLLCPTDAAYPARLREIHDPPPLIFCDGEISLLASLQVAMVGSRRMTATGRRVAHMLAGALAHVGVTVTSGLARGIDAAAHEGALDAGGKTIAVLGSGCDVIYPAGNRSLARRIQENHGLVISEFPLGVGARDYHFPQRNRIVTGMSVGTVVVEAALRSGSLISARLAMEQGREVFAVPGSVLNPMSAGCHKLIRDGAKLTESVEDIIEELSGIVGLAPQGESISMPDQNGRALLACLGAEPVTVDYLAGESGLTVPQILSSLVELEVDGLVENQAGGYVLSPTAVEMIKRTAASDRAWSGTGS